MAKRFTDTDIWREDWFIATPKDYRTLWFYIKDNCDHAGIWKPNIATFNKLFDCQVDFKTALEKFNNGKERIIILKNGRWFLPQFIPFQYGTTLNLNSKTHYSIYQLLISNEVSLTSIRPLVEVTHGVKDKDKDKDIINKNKEIKDFIDFAFKSFEDRFKEKMLVDGGKDGQIVKNLLKTYGLEKLKGLWIEFMQSDDQFIKQAGYSIGVFKTQINKLLSAKKGGKSIASKYAGIGTRIEV